MAHKELNGVDGGALNTSGVFALETFFVRKLNTRLVDRDSILTAFDGSAYSFTLSPGIYRIEASMLVNWLGDTLGSGYCAGLYNVTAGAFEVYTGTTEPILAEAGFGLDGTPSFVEGNRVIKLYAQFTVASTNRTYQIRHKTGCVFPNTWGASTTACGINDQMSGANVNGVAASQFYMIVKIGRES